MITAHPITADLTAAAPTPDASALKGFLDPKVFLARNILPERTRPADTRESIGSSPNPINVAARYKTPDAI